MACYFCIGLSISSWQKLCLLLLFFSLPAIVPDEYFTSGYNQNLVKASDWTRLVRVSLSTITQLFKLIMICDVIYKQFSVIDDGNLLNIDEVESRIYFICTS
jgi:hypothetical protein